jgi:serine/threonine protein kinase/mRNA-degrading endonuclease toxin of MazEF toxin-antitoxin module
VRQWVHRRRARTAKAAATQAAAAALLARPASPDALSALTEALAQADNVDTMDPTALRRLSGTLSSDGAGAVGGSLEAVLLAGDPATFRRVDSSQSELNLPSETTALHAEGAATSPRTAPGTPTITLAAPLPSRYALEFEQGTRLGKGGFGRVYRAKHLLDGAEYAVKKVLLTGSAREQERAVREAMCLAKLDHTNVVRYYQVWKEDVDDDGVAEFDDSSEDEFEESSVTEEDSYTSTSVSRRGRRSTPSRSSAPDDESLCDDESQRAVLHIQMQLCELTLRDYLQESDRVASLEANKPYFLQLLAGLQHIHRNSLIHRDLTPANVFITNDRRTIKIGDFGLSREMSVDMPNLASVSNLTETAERATIAARRGDRREHMRSVTRGVGTTLYMSPEQRACKPYDHKVDIYSAGILLFEMCHPFGTLMERVVVLSNLQRHVLPDEMVGTPEGELIMSMTHETAATRPSVEALLASPLFAARGDICVSVHRDEQYALMPLIREQIEALVHVKSFTAHDIAARQPEASPKYSESASSIVDLVELEYFIEPDGTTEAALEPGADTGERGSIGGDTAERHRQGLERLRAGLTRLNGVARVRGAVFSGLLQSSPRPMPLQHPSSRASESPELRDGDLGTGTRVGSPRPGSRKGSKNSSPRGPHPRPFESLALPPAMRIEVPMGTLPAGAIATPASPDSESSSISSTSPASPPQISLVGGQLSTTSSHVQAPLLFAARNGADHCGPASPPVSPAPSAPSFSPLASPQKVASDSPTSHKGRHGPSMVSLSLDTSFNTLAAANAVAAIDEERDDALEARAEAAADEDAAAEERATTFFASKSSKCGRGASLPVSPDKKQFARGDGKETMRACNEDRHPQQGDEKSMRQLLVPPPLPRGAPPRPMGPKAIHRRVRSFGDIDESARYF